MSIWERNTRQSEDDRLIEKFTRRRPMTGRDAPRFVSCCCGWGAHATTLREANDKFYIHQLSASENSEHVIHIETLPQGPAVFDS